MNKTDNGSDKEPDWMNPANDRETPYTEEEIDTFVEGFIIWSRSTRPSLCHLFAARQQAACGAGTPSDALNLT